MHFFLKFFIYNHSVTERKKTKYTRNLVNFTIRQNINDKPLFKMKRRLSQKAKTIFLNTYSKYFKHNKI